jgi:outer membrane immunogenic protein
LAWVDIQDQWAGTAQGGNPVVSSTATKSGGAFGGGIETILGGNWTSKNEYLYIDAGRGHTLVSTSPMQVDHTFHVFRSSLVYQFGTH